MKTFSKKIISLLLAVIMIVASVPLSVMTAFAGNLDGLDAIDQNLVNVTEAMDAYNLAMDGTIYNSMSDAYAKYVAAQESIDAYKYGDGTVQAMDTAATNLVNAINTMKASGKWTQATATATLHARDNTTDVINTNYAKNLLYADDQTALVDENSSNTKKVRMQMVYSANTVALYDGTNDIIVPVFNFWFYDQTGFSSRKVFALYPTENETSGTPGDNSNFQLQEAWHTAQNGTGDWNASWANDTNKIGCYRSTVNLTIESSQNNRNKWNRASNYMKYVGGSSGFTNGLKTVSPGWFGYTGYSSKENLVNHYMTNVGNIYVIDYASLLAAKNAKVSLLTNDFSNYTQGGMATVLAAFDLMTADNANPAKYTFSSNTATNATNLASKISAAASALNSATATADNEAYDNLRTAIANKQATRETDNDATGTYTTESWNTFVTAYDAAAAIMTNLPSTGYNNAAAAQSAADTLNNVVLELNERRVETAALEVAIDNADDAISNKSYFTTASYTASDIENVVTTAKATVWSSVDKYKADEGKLMDNADNQAIVAAQLNAVKEAVAALVINPDTTAVSAKNYSINSAITYAGTFNASDYSNYAIVTEAVYQAQTYANNPVSIDASTAGSVQAEINTYVSYINDILTAIRNLKAAFSNLSNGTIANEGTSVNTHVNSTRQDGYWTLDFTRNDNQIILRTTHDAATFDLGGATFGWNTNRNADQHLDSINFADANSTVGEQTVDTDKTTVAMTTAQTDSFPGSLSATSNGTYKVSNIYVTGKTGNSEAYGKDASGTNVTSLDYKYDDVLARTDGTVPPQGCITGYSNGNNNTRTTTFTSDYTLSVVKTTAKTLSATTVPTKTTYALNTYLGMVYYFNYSPFLTYYGYSHDRAAYTQSTEVVDISYLVDLIKTCDALNAGDYTTTSWAALGTALTNAKADMDYSNMTSDAILSECVTRYGNLWTAYKALEAPANNTSIKDAISTTKSTYEGGSANYSAASWTAFEEAYTAATNAINNKYSDVNVRAYGTSEQTAIDAIATALLDAYNALESFADFTPVDNAALALAQGLEADKYTTASLEALAADLKDSSKFPYLNKTADERKTVFADSQSLINAEATEIAKLSATVATIDASALDAAAADAKAKFNDPDAFIGIDAAIQQIKSLNIYADVEIYGGVSVSGVKYADQDALDADIASILSSVTVQQYSITVDGTVVATVDYGTEYTVESPNGEKVDWYYAYKSNTSENTAKYYTTDYRMTFVVKGDTTLTTSAVKSTADTVKVTYVNSLNGKTFATDYVTKGSAATLPTAPARAYYQFDNYTLNGSIVSGTVTANKDITVVANYSRTNADNMYTITIINEDGNFGERTITAYYNELVTIDFPTAYAWCKVDEADYDAWLSTTAGTEYIVHYGPSYSFYANEDAHIAVYTQDQYNAELTGAADGSSMVDLAKQDENGASVVVRDDIIVKDGKFGMIGTFVLPDRCELVESGMLFTTTTTADMTLENVGTDGIARMKSSEHTVGNQFVINVRTTNITGNISFAYTAYFTYKDANGVQHTVYSDTVVKNNVNVLQ